MSVRRRDAAATKEALLDAAAKLFAERGFDRTTVRDIASLAGVNQALLFRYFGSKEGLFNEVASRAAREKLATMPPRQLLESVLRAMLSPERSGMSTHVLEAFVRSMDHATATPAVLAELREQYVRTLATLSEADDAELRAHLVLAWLLGIGLVRNAAESAPLARAGSDEVCALVLDAARTLLERA